MTTYYVPSYQDFFPNQEEPLLENLLASVSSKELLKELCVINTNIELEPTDEEVHEEIFKYLCSKINIEKRSTLEGNYENYKSLRHVHKESYRFFFRISILELMVEVLKKPNDIIHSNNNGELLSLVIIRSLLILNGLYDKKVKLLEKSDEKRSLSLAASQYNLHDYIDFYYLIFMSLSIFSYLEGKEKLRKFLYEFLEKLKLNNSEEYTKLILNVYLEILKSKNRVLFMLIPKFITCLDNWSIDVSQNKFPEFPDGYDKDFELLKKKPLLKISEKKYCVLILNFLANKMYRDMIGSIYYDTSLHLSGVYAKFNDFISELGTDFAEKRVFHNVIPQIFDTSTISLMANGDRYSEEYTDYYARDDKDIYLFEFKNYVIKDDVKNSLNYDIVHKKIRDRVVIKTNSQGKVKPTGVSQLINAISKLNDGGFRFDKLNKTNECLTIYPFIVYTDDFFNIEGLQKNIIDVDFRNLLDERNINKYHRVNDVILISLRDIFRVIYTIRFKKVPLKNLIESYITKKNNFKKLLGPNNNEFNALHFKDIMKDSILFIPPESINILFGNNNLFVEFLFSATHVDDN